MLKIDFYRVSYLPWNGTIVKDVFRNLYLHFQGKICQVVILTRLQSANITIAIRWEVTYLPSNGAIRNDVHHDLDLQFQGHEFLNVSFLKIAKASEKCSGMTFIEVSICHRLGQLRMS